MKFNFRILALLLSLLLLLTSCDNVAELFGNTGLFGEAESITETIPSTTKKPSSNKDKPDDEDDEAEIPTAEESSPESSDVDASSVEESTKVTDTEESLEESDEETIEDTVEETVITPEVSETQPKEETKSYRESISRSREEVEAMFVLKEEDFAEAEMLLNNFKDIGMSSSDYDEVDAAYIEFEDAFYHIQTQMSIANIIYYLDTTDTVASERYLDVYGKFGDLYNLYADACKDIYNTSPIRDEIFADWTEAEIDEMLAYDPETQELREANEALQIELNELSESEFFDRSAEIYAQMITNNNRIAKLSGYDNYYDYATEKIYGRDYTREDVEQFAALIREYYLPNYDTVNNNWMEKYYSLPWMSANAMYYYLFDPFDKLEQNYLKGYIESFDGSMRDGLEHMFINRNVIFSDSKNSHPSAFQTYLHSIETPFCLFGVDGQSTDTLVHEMGHYYASLYNPNISSYDLAETQSQGNEMLLLEYLSTSMPGDAYEALRGYKLYVYMAETLICVIIDDFEREVYSLESVEGYTSEDFDAIMDKVCEKYGGKDFINNNITDIDYYWRMVATNNPVYYISYAVSMTEALNILAAVEEDTDTGREIYRTLIEDVYDDITFLDAIELAGLSSPFEQETYEKIVDIMVK